MNRTGRPVKRKLRSRVIEDELLKRVRRGEEGSQEEAVEWYGEDVYFLAVALLNERHPELKSKVLDMAVGLMKEVFAECWRGEYFLTDIRGLRDILLDITLLVYINGDLRDESNAND